MGKRSLNAVIAFSVALAAMIAGIAAFLWTEIPRWGVTGTHTIAAQSVGWDAEAIQCPAPGTRIAIFGDSHVAGSRMDSGFGSKGPAFGKILEEQIRGVESVSLFGIGGQTAQAGESTWRDYDVEAEIVIVAYGTNDAAPRGWLRNRKPVPIEAFKEAVSQMVDGLQVEGREVFLMAPPPAGSAAIMRRLVPYREAARDLARNKDISLLDPADAFAGCDSQQPLLTFDALHMNANGHQCLGKWLARKLCPDPQLSGTGE